MIAQARVAGGEIGDAESVLLAYVRKQPLKPEALDRDTFARDALPMFRNTLGERIELETQLEPCRALVDKAQLTTSSLIPGRATAQP